MDGSDFLQENVFGYCQACSSPREPDRHTPRASLRTPKLFVSSSVKRSVKSSTTVASPTAAPRRSGGVPVTGKTCDACGMTITKGQLLMDGAARVGRGDWSVQFHVACFEVWNEERRTRKTA